MIYTCSNPVDPLNQFLSRSAKRDLQASGINGMARSMSLGDANAIPTGAFSRYGSEKENLRSIVAKEFEKFLLVSVGVLLEAVECRLSTVQHRLQRKRLESW